MSSQAVGHVVKLSCPAIGASRPVITTGTGFLHIQAEACFNASPGQVIFPDSVYPCLCLRVVRDNGHESGTRAAVVLDEHDLTSRLDLPGAVIPLPAQKMLE